MRRSECGCCGSRDGRLPAGIPQGPLATLRLAWALATGPTPVAFQAAGGVGGQGSGGGGGSDGGGSDGGSSGSGGSDGGSGDEQRGGFEPGISDRRSFFRRLSLLAGGLGASLVAIPAVWFIVQPLARERREAWRDVGPIGDFPLGSTKVVQYEDPSPLNWAGVTAKTAAYVRRESDGWTAFTINCSHLGCPVRWEEKAGLFFCPCHGGVFYRNGDVAAGPPEAPLARYPVRVQEGRVLIRTASVPIAGNLER